MTTPSQGTVILQGLKTGNIYSYGIYISDLGGVNWKWATDVTAAAASSDFIITPNEPCRIIDICTTAAPTVSLTSAILTNDVSTGQVVVIANTAAALSNRSIPRIVIAPGKKLTIKQL